MTYDPYVGRSDVEPPEGITLEEYAKAWIDMEPHTAALTSLARAFGLLVVEFGVRGAVSTWALLDGMPEDGRLIGVDIIPDRQWYRDHGHPNYDGYATPIPPRVRNDPRFEFRAGSSLEVDLPERCTMVMIDSGHDYKLTVAELARAATMEPTIIALHDYLYLVEPGVRQAVDEFLASGTYKWRMLWPSKWGLAVLERA